MRYIYFGFMLLASFHLRGAQTEPWKTLGAVNHWHYDLQRGGVDVVLYDQSLGASRPGRPRLVLSFQPSRSGSSPTIREETDILKELLPQLSSLGYDPHYLAGINTPLQGSEVQVGVDNSVTETGKWEEWCLRHEYCWPVNDIGSKYLKSIDAFKEFDDALHLYGLKRNGIFIDEPGCMKAPDSAPNSKAGSGEKAAALCDGTIWVEVIQQQK